MTLDGALEKLLNQYCRENLSGTPDFLLAEYMMSCLRAYESAVHKRDRWYFGKLLSPGERTVTDTRTEP